jgi:hypothetical protein
MMQRFDRLSANGVKCCSVNYLMFISALPEGLSLLQLSAWHSDYYLEFLKNFVLQSCGA